MQNPFKAVTALLSRGISSGRNSLNGSPRNIDSDLIEPCALFGGTKCVPDTANSFLPLMSRSCGKVGDNMAQIS